MFQRSENSRTPRNRRLIKIAAAVAATGLLAAGAAFTLGAGSTPAGNKVEASYAVTIDGEAEYRKSAAAGTGTVNLENVRDSEEHLSYPEPESSKRHRVAKMPAASTTRRPSAGVVSPTELRKGMQAGSPGKLQLLADGTASAPLDAPPEVQNIVAAANTIAKFPYRWGGGHGSFEDDAYDCSGSLSYALAAAGMVGKPLVSGELARWGDEGAGKWLTIYAHGGHTYMVVGGLRYDTSFRDGLRGSRWQTASRPTKGFAVRHWPGL